MLQSAAHMVQDPAVANALQNPNVTTQELADLFSSVLKTVLDKERTNFIRLLAENNRLNILPDIAAGFIAARSEAEKTLAVDVTSATELTAAYQTQLVTALTKRLGRQVTLNCVVDPSLIGGVIVRAGDLVIDGSVSGKLTRLNDFI
jgi:F-type H+-transporting ATPase subunit delta